MYQLTTADVTCIATTLASIARPLDWALWQAWRGDATWDDVVPHLAAYQNADGGFGHGIEPDVWHPASSPLATTMALQYAQRAGIPTHHECIQRALAYLVTAYDTCADKWHPMTAGVNDHPHAPWWHANEHTGQNALDSDWPNPTVEIIGYLSAYQGATIDLMTLCDALVTHVVHADKMESHALACYVRAYDWLPATVQGVVYPHLVRLLHATVHPVPAAWAVAYVPTPLDYVHTPASPFFAEMAHLVDIQLTQWCQHVQINGVWTPTWEWGQDVDAWATARAWWTGKMTVERMMILANFGYIE
ncbi:MAG: hypothetical protein RI985_2108 [Chloroflexota bacterium]|jgi:hypothetical protein